MWVFSRAGFFSAVQKGSDKGAEVCVRGRVRADFDRLRDLYFPDMGQVLSKGGTDYPYRIYVSHDQWAKIMESMAQDVDYKNFKGMISGERGYAVADLYSDVWAVMYGAEKKVIPERKPIPVDFSSRHAPPFEEWRVEKGVEARERAAETNEKLDEEESASRRLKAVPGLSDTSNPIEVFQKRYEQAQADLRTKRKASKKASKKAKAAAKTVKPSRGANGRFASKGQ